MATAATKHVHNPGTLTATFLINVKQHRDSLSRSTEIPAQPRDSSQLLRATARTSRICMHWHSL